MYHELCKKLLHRQKRTTVSINRYSKDVQNAKVTSFFNEEVDIPGYKPELVPDSMKLREVAKAISKSKRPLLYIGGGVIHSGGSDELFEFAREPYSSRFNFNGTWCISTGRSIVSRDAWYAWDIHANMAVTECDLLLALGVRFDDACNRKIRTFSPHSKKYILILILLSFIKM